MQMLLHKILLVSMSIFLVSPCLFAQKLPEHIKKNYTLVWNEEFDGSKLDMDMWNHRGLETTRDIAIVKAKNSYLDGNGNCVIELTKVGDEYHIGQISTMLSYLTRYGYFECRAKMNHEHGPHIAFWIQSPYISQGGPPDKIGAEIDVFEYLLKYPQKIYHTVHYGGYSEELHKKSGGSVKIDDIKEGFHTFGVEWHEDEYIFYVNGQETWRTKEGVSNIAQYLILSIECCGWGGDVTKSNLPDEVIFDYVRVYKKKREKR